mmetsp:Transcript_33696/g.81574  ORF Transcript_33696/g.81574 Transcript_33696/m.81574 type:complete len:273 (+) Transcript_33696:16-834(+)
MCDAHEPITYYARRSTTAPPMTSTAVDTAGWATAFKRTPPRCLRGAQKLVDVSCATAVVLLRVPSLGQRHSHEQQPQNHNSNQNRIFQILLEIRPVLNYRPQLQLSTRAFSGSVQRPAQRWRSSGNPHGDDTNGTARINLRDGAGGDEGTGRLAITWGRTVWQSLCLHPACHQKLLRGTCNTVSHSRSRGCICNRAVAQIGHHGINCRFGQQQRQLSFPAPRRGITHERRNALPVWKHFVCLDHQQIGGGIHCIEDGGWILLFCPHHNISFR